MKMTVSKAMVECLLAEGISTVYGYPGAAICPFYDELKNSEKDIRHVLVRHEANAGHAANGYARISGKPAVCIATSGPGATNLITAIATAYADSIPIICITGQVNTDQIGSDVFQEADITGAAESFVKYSYLVKNRYINSYHDLKERIAVVFPLSSPEDTKDVLPELWHLGSRLVDISD